MYKRTLIVKNEAAVMRLYPSHVEVVSPGETKQYIGLLHLSALYLNQKVSVPLQDLLRIAQYIPVYFIDGNRNIVGKICNRRAG